MIGIATVAVLGIGIGGYLYYRHANKRKRDGASKSDESPHAPTVTSFTPPNVPLVPSSNSANTSGAQAICNKPYLRLRGDSFPLSFGSEGANVLLLQRAINLYGENIATDAKFGCETENALNRVARVTSADASLFNALRNPPNYNQTG